MLIVRSCVQIIGGAAEKKKQLFCESESAWSQTCLKKDCLDLLKDMEMWTNLPALIPLCSGPVRTNDIMDMCTKSSNKMQICLIQTADNTFRSKFDICKF